MKIQLFIPCFIDQFYPETAWNIIKIFKKLNVEVLYNPKTTCCGQVSFNSGYWKGTKKIAKKFIKDYEPNIPIVGPTASCVGFVKNYYPDVFENDPDIIKFSSNIYEFTDYLVNHLNVENLGSKFEGKVAYHSSCASLREYKLKDEPYKLLQNVEGLELVSFKDADVCCGFGGTFAVKHEPISTAMAQQKIENILEAGSEYITSVDSSCLLHLQSYILKHKINLKTLHIADILASGL
jgi:L-lactate dehydrogenase complex protein LldE